MVATMYGNCVMGSRYIKIVHAILFLTFENYTYTAKCVYFIRFTNRAVNFGKISAVS